MGRYVKCQFCNETEPMSFRSEMEVEQKVTEKSKKNLYYHVDCYPKHLKKQEFLTKEKQEMDELNDLVKSIHGVKFSLAPRYWEMINDLRNGTNRYTKFFKKRYKKGIPYNVLQEAYKLAKQDIAWAKLNKKFRDTDAEVMYCLQIAHRKVNDAHKKLKRTEQSEKISKAMEEVQLKHTSDDREVTFASQKSKHDISHILGDD